MGGGGSKSFFFQAEDGIRGLVRSRGLGDVYKRKDEVRSMMVTETDYRQEGENMESVTSTHLMLPTIYPV